MRDRLAELIFESGILCRRCGEFSRNYCSEYIAKYLLENGVIALSHKPINVMLIEDSTDVCCPYCETILSGLYGEEQTDIIQCYVCGAFLDNTGAITREEAEQALKGEQT